MGSSRQTRRRATGSAKSSASDSAAKRKVLGRACKQVVVNVRAVAECAVKGLVKGRDDAATLKPHLAAIEMHRLVYTARLNQAQAKLKKGDASEEQAIAPHKAKITEAKGEREATLLMMQKFGPANGDFQLVRGFSAGTGIDQIWYSAEQDAYIIVEAKGPGATLSTGAAKGDQMSKMWVKASLEEERDRSEDGSPEQGNAKRMLGAMQKGPPPQVLGLVIEANPGGGAELRGCPDKGVYHKQK